jgi:hypothetical protein
VFECSRSYLAPSRHVARLPRSCRRCVRPVWVCTLERLSFLHVSLHESLGLGFASEIKSSAGSRGAQHPVAAAANACHDASMATGWGRRLLIATGGAAASEDELPPLVRALIETASELLVMTPMLVGRLQWLASDSDRARYEADERLSTVLGHVETIAPEAAIEGRIGDDTPFTAFADAIRDFRARSHPGRPPWSRSLRLAGTRLTRPDQGVRHPDHGVRARRGGTAASPDVARRGGGAGSDLPGCGRLRPRADREPDARRPHRRAHLSAHRARLSPRPVGLRLRGTWRLWPAYRPDEIRAAGLSS